MALGCLELLFINIFQAQPLSCNPSPACVPAASGCCCELGQVWKQTAPGPASNSHPGGRVPHLAGLSLPICAVGLPVDRKEVANRGLQPGAAACDPSTSSALGRRYTNSPA